MIFYKADNESLMFFKAKDRKLIVFYKRGCLADMPEPENRGRKQSGRDHEKDKMS